MSLAGWIGFLPVLKDHSSIKIVTLPHHLVLNFTLPIYVHASIHSSIAKDLH